MNKSLLSLIILGAFLTGCAVSKTKLSDDGRKVKVLSKTEKTNCSVLDKVIGMNEKGSDELAQNHARNLAADIDGNALFFDEMVSMGNNVKAYATVYQCD